MRFHREEKIPFEWTHRKAAAALLKQKREREAMPLFASQVAATQRPIDEVRVTRERNWNEGTLKWRNQLAASWRHSRRALRALPLTEKQKCLAEWNAGKCPSKSEYFGNHVWLVYRRLGLVGPGNKDFMAEWIAAIERLERAEVQAA